MNDFMYALSINPLNRTVSQQHQKIVEQQQRALTAYFMAKGYGVQKQEERKMGTIEYPESNNLHNPLPKGYEYK